MGHGPWRSFSPTTSLVVHRLSAFADHQKKEYIMIAGIITTAIISYLLIGWVMTGLMIRYDWLDMKMMADDPFFLALVTLFWPMVILVGTVACIGIGFQRTFKIFTRGS